MKITEVSDENMFWGVTLEGGKQYAQTVQKSFHISMAALEPVQVGKGGGGMDGKHTSLMIHHDKAEFLLCTLTHGRLYQQPLDLNFTEGEELRFFLNGPGIVHLTGYLTPDEPLDDGAEFSEDEMDSSFVEEGESSDEEDDSDEEEDSDEDDSDEEVPKLKPIKFSMDSSPDSSPEKTSTKRKKSQKDKKQKKKKRIESSSEEENSEEEDIEDSDEVDEEEDMEEDDDEWETDEDNFIDDEAEEAGSDEEESEESDEDDHMVATSGSFLQPQKGKVKKEMEKLKKEKKAESTKKNGKAESNSPKKNVKKESESPKTNGEQPTENGTPETGKKKKKKKKKNKQKDDESNAADTSTSQVNTSKSATSSPDKTGKPKKRTIKGGVNVEEVKEGHGPEAMHGKMVSVYYSGKLENGKQFDACTSGKPFKFKLGKGDVIKGWDNGVAGMKVGGKRKLIIPPSQGYGNQKTGPIPRNSTLHFEVELKAVS